MDGIQSESMEAVGNTAVDIVQSNMAADSGMDTCPSPEIQDSRKRPLDGDVENGVTKKSHYAGGADGTYHFKMLVPSVAAGAIIGKGGDTIAQLQKDAGARVKMSKANDFYPGTSERVCLITGNVDAIMAVLTFIMEKIREKPDLNAKQAIDFDNKTAAERDKQVKILVPNSTAGMIIGKAGNYIKQIKEESGSYVQISQKAKDQTLQERCITVIGDMESNKTACLMILAKVVEDPQSGTCLNVSYADVSGPVANYNPTGSPYANHSNQQTPMHTTFNSTGSLNTPVSSVGGMLLNGGGLNLSLNLGAPSGGTSLTSQLLEHIKLTLRGSGYNEQATSEITAAMTTLAQYGILGMGLGLTAGSGNNSSSSHALVSGSYLGVSPMESTPSPQTANGVGNNGGVFGPIGTVSGLGSSSPTPRSSGTGQQQPPMSICKSPTPSEMKGEQKKIELEISENIVGAILGPGGRSLVEIQHMSCANIQISKKGYGGVQMGSSVEVLFYFTFCLDLFFMGK
ncbi:RNA-binding protein Nova-1, partial [Gryllus bimaculatus]